MTTTKTQANEAINKISESTNAYIERLQQGHEKFAEVVDTARTRTALINDKLIETIIAGQRDALDFGKAVAAQPTEFGKNLEAAMQALTAAQERAVDLTKVFYRVQADAAADARAIASRLFEGSKSFAKPFEKITAMWLPSTK